MEQLKMCAVPHQHFLVDINVARVINIMYSIKWQEDTQPTRLLRHNLVSTIEATGVPEKVPGREATDDQRGTAQQQPQTNLTEDFRQAKMESTTIFCSRAGWNAYDLNLAVGTNFQLYTRYCWLSGQRNALLT